MPISASNRQATTVRPINLSDVRYILRMVETAWRVCLRASLAEFASKLKTVPGFMAEDNIGLRGFMVIEPQPPDMAQLIGAGLRDTWNVKPYLDLLLPEIENAVRDHNLSHLVSISNDGWLIEELRPRGFKTREWIIVMQRPGVEQPLEPATPAVLRRAQPDDLPALITLDTLAFDQIWHKSIRNFAEALKRKDSFIVADLAGQIVGYEWCELQPQHAHLNRLAVHPNYQGRGIGAQLLHRAISDALAGGIKKLTLNTQETNRRSRALYERFGFVATNQRMPVLVKLLD
jgi:ribosomal-protein-alanine N-acetyltransferase